MGIFMFISIGILIIGLVSLTSPNARGFSIPMIAIGGFFTLSLLFIYLYFYLKARNVKGFIQGDYYVIETTCTDSNYKYLLTKREFKPNDYVMVDQSCDHKKIVFKVAKCEKLRYKSSKDNNFPVDKTLWEDRVVKSDFNPNYVFAKVRFPGWSFHKSIEINAIIRKIDNPSDKTNSYGFRIEYYDPKTRSTKKEWRSDGKVVQIYNFDELFNKTSGCFYLNTFGYCEKVINKTVSTQRPLPTNNNGRVSHPACIVVGVSFNSSSKVYYYLSDRDYSYGTAVSVSTKEGNKTAKVVSSKHYSQSEVLPYDYYSMKRVIGFSTSNARYQKAEQYDYDYEPDYPDPREQEEFDREMDRISERMEQAAEDGYYFDDYGVFHDLSDD